MTIVWHFDKSDNLAQAELPFNVVCGNNAELGIYNMFRSHLIRERIRREEANLQRAQLVERRAREECSRLRAKLAALAALPAE